MNFRVFIIFFGLILLLPGPGQAKKVAVVLSRSLSAYAAAVKGFGASASSWEYRVLNMEGDMEKGRRIMQRLKPGKTSLVVAVGTEAAFAAKTLNRSLPLICTMILNPPDLPQRPATGVIIKPGIDAQLKRIHKLLPTKNRIGVIYDPRYSSESIRDARQHVDPHDLTLLPIAIEKQEDIPQVLLKLTKDRVDILWMVLDKTLARPAAFDLLLQHSFKEKLPLFGLSPRHVKAGALAAFYVDFQDIGKQTAQLAAKILDGKKKTNWESPRKLIIYVNPKTQKMLGINDLGVFPEVRFIQ
jgi:putative ABC transport system substrate-binding protein